MSRPTELNVEEPVADRSAAVTSWTNAVATGGDAVAVLAAFLALDVVAAAPTGDEQGRDAVAAAIGAGRLSALLGAATWSEPEVDGDTVTVSAALPAGSPIAGSQVRFTFGPDDLVTRVDQSVTMAPPPEESPVAMETLAPLIDNALAEGNPMLLVYVDGDGQPSVSYRGSVQVRSSDQLQVWVRNPDGGLLRALPNNDRVTLWYRGEGGANLHVKGRASVLADPADRQAVYDTTPEPERRADRDCKGQAIVVDVDTVLGRGPGGAVRMTKAAQRER